MEQEQETIKNSENNKELLENKNIKVIKKFNRMFQRYIDEMSIIGEEKYEEMEIKKR